MGYCENCGFRVPRDQEYCERCANLDFSYVSEDAKPVDPEEIRFAETGGYVLETTTFWSRSEYIAIQDPEDVDNVLEHQTETEKPTGFFGIVDLFRKRRQN